MSTVMATSCGQRASTASHVPTVRPLALHRGEDLDVGQGGVGGRGVQAHHDVPGVQGGGRRLG
jgi:hypothetical protein